MRIVTWNCNMALHRKVEHLLALKPDIAVISECADPETLALRGDTDWIETEPVWVGENRNKGLGIFAFNGFQVARHGSYRPTLRYIAPVRVRGRVAFDLLAVWAQNLSGGNTRKHQLGPLRRALSHYGEVFARNGPVVVAGDLNNNVFWDRPGWRINHLPVVEKLERFGLTSAYHAVTGEGQGEEQVPTLYWRDRRKDGPTYHIDYIFLPHAWIDAVRDFKVGTFEDWCGQRLSDHVPLTVDIDV